MAYRYDLNISPVTLTDLTVTIEYDSQEFPTKTLTLSDFSIEDDELSKAVTISADCTITIQSQGYATETYNILVGETETDIHITLTPVQNYFSKVSDGINIYWVKDLYARETLETKADSSDIPTKTSDLTNNSGYITGITSSDVTTALGYTPYNSSNPNGYITSADLPTVNDATITFTQGGTTKGTITLNQSSNQTIALDAGGGGGGAVDSVNGQTGVVVLTASDVGALATTDVTEYTAAEVETLWGSI